MAKIKKKYVDLDKDTGIVGTDVVIEAGGSKNIKEYIDYVANSGVQVTADTRDPNANDDTDAGFAVGDVFINTDSDESFRCVDNTADNAVWIKTSLTADELSTEAFLTEVREILTLSNTDITNKYVDLGHIPYNGELELTPIGGGEQEINADFEVKDDGNGNVKRLSWDGKGLDGVLEENDKLQLEYKYL